MSQQLVENYPLSSVRSGAGQRFKSAFISAGKLVTDPGRLTAALHYTCSRLYGYGIPGKIVGKILWRINVWQSSCHIDPAAKIGADLMLPHPTGIVIGKATIGSRVKIHQNVSIGFRRSTDKNHPERFPTIGNNVVIGAGAVILGSIDIGDGAVIGANSVVLADVPPKSLAVGVPAQIVPQEGQADIVRLAINNK